MLKILEVHKYISNSPDGIATFIIDSMENMDRTGMIIDLLSVHTSENQNYKSRVEGMGGSLHSLSYSSGKRMFTIFPSMIRFLKHFNYDVIHVHTGWIVEMTAWAIAAKCVGVRKVIVHSHNNSTKDSPFVHALKCFLFRPILLLFADEYCACTHETAEWTFGKRQAKRTHILKNGITVENFHFDLNQRIAAREKMSIPQSAFVIGHVGRISPEKNHLFLISVFSNLAKKEPNARLLLIGDGPAKQSIQECIRELKLEEKTILQGYVKDVNFFLQAMDVFCFPSVKESFGIASIEAQASGLPVVASEGVPMETKITDSVDFLCFDETVDVWADTLLKYRLFCRKDQTACIRQAGLDMASTSAEIRKLYLA